MDKKAKKGHSPWTASKPRKKNRQLLDSDEEPTSDLAAAQDENQAPSGACSMDVQMLASEFKSCRVRKASGSKAYTRPSSNKAPGPFGFAPSSILQSSNSLPCATIFPAQPTHGSRQNVGTWAPDARPLAASLAFLSAASNGTPGSHAASQELARHSMPPPGSMHPHFGAPAAVGHSWDAARDAARPVVDLQAVSADTLQGTSTLAGPGLTHAISLSASQGIPSVSLGPLPFPASLGSGLAGTSAAAAAQVPGAWDADTPRGRRRCREDILSSGGAELAVTDTREDQPHVSEDPPNVRIGEGREEGVLEEEADGHFFPQFCDQGEGDVWEDVREDDFKIKCRATYSARTTTSEDGFGPADGLQPFRQGHAAGVHFCTPRAPSGSGFFTTPRTSAGGATTPAATLSTGFMTVSTGKPGSASRPAPGSAHMAAAWEVHHYGRAGYCSGATTGTPVPRVQRRRAAGTPAGHLLRRRLQDWHEEELEEDETKALPENSPSEGRCTGMQAPPGSAEHPQQASGDVGLVASPTSTIRASAGMHVTRPDAAPMKPPGSLISTAVAALRTRLTWNGASHSSRCSSGAGLATDDEQANTTSATNTRGPGSMQESEMGEGDLTLLAGGEEAGRAVSMLRVRMGVPRVQPAHDEDALANLMCDEVDFTTPCHSPRLHCRPSWLEGTEAKSDLRRTHSAGELAMSHDRQASRDTASYGPAGSFQAAQLAGLPHWPGAVVGATALPPQMLVGMSADWVMQQGLEMHVGQDLSNLCKLLPNASHHVASLGAHSDEQLSYKQDEELFLEGPEQQELEGWGLRRASHQTHASSSHSEACMVTFDTTVDTCEFDADGGRPAAFEVPVHSLSCLKDFNYHMSKAAEVGDCGRAERVWAEMRSRCQPDLCTLNFFMRPFYVNVALHRCLRKGITHPDDAEQLMHDVCMCGGLQPSDSIMTLVCEIRSRWEQLHAC